MEIAPKTVRPPPEDLSLDLRVIFHLPGRNHLG